MGSRRRRFFCSAAMIALAALFVAASSLDVTARPLDEVYALSIGSISSGQRTNQRKLCRSRFERLKLQNDISDLTTGKR